MSERPEQESAEIPPREALTRPAPPRGSIFMPGKRTQSVAVALAAAAWVSGVLGAWLEGWIWPAALTGFASALALWAFLDNHFYFLNRRTNTPGPASHAPIPAGDPGPDET